MKYEDFEETNRIRGIRYFETQQVVTLITKCTCYLVLHINYKKELTNQKWFK